MNRFEHYKKVSELMFNVSRNHLKWSEKKSIAMANLGFIHDLGYQLGFDNENHAVGFGEKLIGYDYQNEVELHGSNMSINSIELLLLNIVDMMVDQNGNFITFEKRLDDIKSRYGVTSYQYSNSCELIEHLIYEDKRMSLYIIHYLLEIM